MPVWIHPRNTFIYPLLFWRVFYFPACSGMPQYPFSASVSPHKAINDADNASSEFLQIKYLVERIRGSIYDYFVISGERKASLERVNSDWTRGNGSKVGHGKLLLDSGLKKKSCLYYKDSKTLKFMGEFVESPSREAFRTHLSRALSPLFQLVLLQME